MTLLSDGTKKEIKRAANFGGFLSLANQVEYWWGNRITSDYLSLYRPFISDHSVCFDIGAHYGRKTKLFRELGARVVAVEPIADCCRKLRELYANDPKTTIIERACGPSAGRATLRYCCLNPQNSAIAGSSREEPNAEDCNVLMTTLDALIEVYGVPSFCKIDCEGYEHAVLSGLSSRVPSISFEFHSSDLTAVESCTGRLIQLSGMTVLTSLVRVCIASLQLLGLHRQSYCVASRLSHHKLPETFSLLTRSCRSPPEFRQD
jgi:FkbM family methyltransferase